MRYVLHKKPLTAASQLRRWLREADPIDIAKDHLKVFRLINENGLKNPMKNDNQFLLGELMGILSKFKKGSRV